MDLSTGHKTSAPGPHLARCPLVAHLWPKLLLSGDLLSAINRRVIKCLYNFHAMFHIRWIYLELWYIYFFRRRPLWFESSTPNFWCAV